MSDLNNTIQQLLKFRNDRDWEQFHNSKDLAIAISLEAAELLELFLWKKEEDFSKERLEEELADILSFCLLLAHKHSLDVNKIIEAKLAKNAEKYPIDKARGNAKKYSDL